MGKEEEKKEGEGKEGKKEHKPVCSVCGKPSEAIICHGCEEKIRGEAFDKKRDVEKAGRTDKG